MSQCDEAVKQPAACENSAHCDSDSIIYVTHVTAHYITQTVSLFFNEQ